MLSEKEFNDKLFQPDMGLYFTPAFILDTFNFYINSYGLENVLKHRNAKKLKELWAGATFLLGYQKMTDTEQYISPCFDTTPDVIFGTYVDSKRLEGSNDFALMNVEITEWEHRTSQDLLARIKDKLKNKNYPKDYVLLLHITKMGNVDTNMDFVFKQLQIEKPNIQGIWVLVGNSKPDCEDNYSAFCVYPTKGLINFSLSDYYKNDAKRVPPIMQVKTKKRGNNMSVHPIKMEMPNLE